MYQIVTTPAARKSIRKLPKHVQKHIKQQLSALANDPEAGKRLRGEFKALHSLRTVFRRTHYRAVYEIDYQHREITVHFVGTRQNFYASLKNKRPQMLNK